MSASTRWTRPQLIVMGISQLALAMALAGASVDLQTGYADPNSPSYDMVSGAVNWYPALIISLIGAILFAVFMIKAILRRPVL